MPQNHTAALQQSLGFMPRRPLTSGSGVIVDSAAGTIALDPVGVTSLVTFGTGAPAGVPANGALYFDTTLPVYIGHVGRSGTWHPF